MNEELCLSSIFFHFLSLILSHPLYFFYLLFFSPYLLKLISFLSPLLTTTSLFLLIPFFPLPPQDDLHHWLNHVFEEPIQEAETKAKDTVEVIPNKEENRSDSSSFSSSKQQIKQRDEWRRRSAQLGPKFFEERYNDDNNNNKEDEMDLLWEMYEAKEGTMGKRGSDDPKKKDLRSLVNQKEAEEEEEEEEEEIGKICCLQALKFSTGKMRFEIGKRSGLTKISKAFKGLKFLHHLNNAGKKSRHS